MNSLIARDYKPYVALAHCSVLSNLEHNNLILWLIINSLIARDYKPYVALTCFKSYISILINMSMT